MLGFLNRRWWNNPLFELVARINTEVPALWSGQRIYLSANEDVKSFHVNGIEILERNFNSGRGTGLGNLTLYPTPQNVLFTFVDDDDNILFQEVPATSLIPRNGRVPSYFGKINPYKSYFEGVGVTPDADARIIALNFYTTQNK